jgi:hypothetical protein
MDRAELLRGGGPDLAAGPGGEPETSECPAGGLDTQGAPPRRRFLAVAGLAAGAVPLSGWLRSFYATAHQHASGQAYRNYEDPT